MKTKGKGKVETKGKGKSTGSGKTSGTSGGSSGGKSTSTSVVGAAAAATASASALPIAFSRTGSTLSSYDDPVTTGVDIVGGGGTVGTSLGGIGEDDGIEVVSGNITSIGLEDGEDEDLSMKSSSVWAKNSAYTMGGTSNGSAYGRNDKLEGVVGSDINGGYLTTSNPYHAFSAAGTITNPTESSSGYIHPYAMTTTTTPTSTSNGYISTVYHSTSGTHAYTIPGSVPTGNTDSYSVGRPNQSTYTGGNIDGAIAGYNREVSANIQSSAVNEHASITSSSSLGTQNAAMTPLAPTTITKGTKRKADAIEPDEDGSSSHGGEGNRGGSTAHAQLNGTTQQSAGQKASRGGSSKSATSSSVGVTTQPSKARGSTVKKGTNAHRTKNERPTKKARITKAK